MSKKLSGHQKDRQNFSLKKDIIQNIFLLEMTRIRVHVTSENGKATPAAYFCIKRENKMKMTTNDEKNKNNTLQLMMENLQEWHGSIGSCSCFTNQSISFPFLLEMEMM